MEDQVWKKQKEEECASLYAEAYAAANRIVKDDVEFQKFLVLLARFASFYSLTNILLIYRQCPDARQLLSYDAWLEQKNPVKRGSSAVKLLTSKTIKSGNEERTVFNTVSLFDISQTQQPERPAGTVVKNTKKYCAILLNTCPIEPQVKEDLREVSGNATAYYNNTLQQLELRANTGENLRIFQDIVQELSLYYISTKIELYDRNKEIRKALCVAWTICKAYYIDPSGIRINGVWRAWKGEDEREVMDALNLIHYAVREIRRKIDSSFFKDLNENARAIRPVSEEIYDSAV